MSVLNSREFPLGAIAKLLLLGSVTTFRLNPPGIQTRPPRPHGPPAQPPGLAATAASAADFGSHCAHPRTPPPPAPTAEAPGIPDPDGPASVPYVSMLS